MSQHDNWSSRLGFILAAAGSAIGLGAIWKFPYTAGTHGGAVFFLLFIVFTQPAQRDSGVSPHPPRQRLAAGRLARCGDLFCVVVVL